MAVTVDKSPFHSSIVRQRLESSGGLPKFVQEAIRAAKIRPRLGVIAFDIGFELNASRCQLHSCLSHIFHLESQNWASMKWIIPALGTGDLEQLS